jgi:hypothetical protein
MISQQITRLTVRGMQFRGLSSSLARAFATAMAVPFALSVSHAQTTDTLAAVRDSDQNVRMALFKTGGFVLNGAFNSSDGSIPAEGPGTRVMWYPEKGAFRAGSTSATQWHDINIGDHSVAMGLDTRASGDYGMAFGFGCTASGGYTFAAGESNTASGFASVALGFHAHTNARQGSFVFADRSSPDTLRAGLNHSANWRISGGFRMFTSSNLSTGVTVQSGAVTSNWGQSNAVISTSTGAYLSTSGVWTNTSDVNRKHHFEQVSGEDVLERLRKMPVTSWTYKTEADSIRHIGPMAQDFYKAFKLGADNKAIGTVDEAGVALVAVKALEERTRDLAMEMENLKADNAELRQLLKQKDNDWMAPGAIAIALLAGAGLMVLLIRRRAASPY